MKRMGLMIAILGLFLFAQTTQAQWTPAIRLTWNSGSSWGQTVAVDFSGNPHVVWSDDTPGNSEIYYAKSTDGGVTWPNGQRITWTSGSSGSPVIAVDSSGNPHVVWSDYTPGNSEIFYKKSTDGGATWIANRRLTWTSGYSYDPVIAIDLSGNPHVVWVDNTPGNYEIYYTKSTDEGVSWTTRKRLTWTSGSSGNVDIGVDSSGYLHVVWEDDTPGFTEIYYKKSKDGGATWTTTKRLTWTWWGDSRQPAIAIDSSDNLHLVWNDDTPGNEELYYKKSTDGGASWTPNKRLTWSAHNSYNQAIAVDSSGQPHVVWEDIMAGYYGLLYIKSTDGGATWTFPQRVTGSMENSPDMASDSYDNLHVVYYNYGENAEIYYQKYIKK